MSAASGVLHGEDPCKALILCDERVPKRPEHVDAVVQLHALFAAGRRFASSCVEFDRSALPDE